MEFRKFTSAALFLFTVFTVTGCNNNGNQTIETGVQSTLAETLDTALEANIGMNEPGLTMSVWQDGAELYSNSRGLAGPDHAINERTPFRLASVSKTFTALAILILYERGSINLHDSVLAYLPQLDESWRAITIHHLLSHRSGIPDYANDLDINEILPDGITASTIVDYFVRNPELEFAPGTNSDYSNTGFVLLSEIVSAVAGLSYADFMQVEIFQPIGMTDSFVWDENANPTPQTAMNFAQNHQVFGRDFHGIGSSSQVSSLEDMQRFLTALLAGQIIQPDTLELMLQVHSESLIEEDSWRAGYGVFFYHEGTTSVFGHAGGNDGFATIYLVDSRIDALVIILGNGGKSLPDYGYLLNLVGEFVN